MADKGPEFVDTNLINIATDVKMLRMAMENKPKTTNTNKTKQGSKVETKSRDNTDAPLQEYGDKLEEDSLKLITGALYQRQTPRFNLNSHQITAVDNLQNSIAILKADCENEAAETQFWKCLRELGELIDPETTALTTFEDKDEAVNVTDAQYDSDLEDERMLIPPRLRRDARLRKKDRPDHALDEDVLLDLADHQTEHVEEGADEDMEDE